MSGTAAVPAIAGAAQAIQRPGEWSDAADPKGPIELMVQAARAAAGDAGAPAMLERVGWIGVAGGIPGYRNPAQLVAARIGAPDAATALTSASGSSPQELVGVAAARIARGDLDVALVLGGDAAWSMRKLRAAGDAPRWITASGEGQPEMLSPMPPEMSERIGAPAHIYVLFDDSLRLARGESVDEHRDRIAALWSRFSAVAATNPYAWDMTAHPPDEIREPSDDNRMISFPYTKALVANNTVNMASALLLCSVEAADAAGIARDRLVFPHAVTTSHETWRVVNRDVLHRAPAVKAAGEAALSFAGIGVDDLSHVDLYACFPSIVQMTVDALGFDVSRPLTVTGGLGFAGAPLSNSSGHGIAAMVPLVRAGGWGFVHANGGFATKHAFGVYASHPPSSFVQVDCQDRVKDRPREAVPGDWDGTGRVEAATVVFERDGPSYVLAALRSADDRRGWARSPDVDLIGAAVGPDGLGGTSMRRAADGTLQA